MRRVRGVSPELRDAARALRREMTEAERDLWNGIRGWKVAGGVKFRRQHPLGRFILDFYCHAARLCVEVDGGIHDAQPERDAERDASLAAAGIKTLRIRNEEVCADIRAVLRRIEREVWQRTRKEHNVHETPGTLSRSVRSVGEGGGSKAAG